MDGCASQTRPIKGCVRDHIELHVCQCQRLERYRTLRAEVRSAAQPESIEHRGAQNQLEPGHLCRARPVDLRSSGQLAFDRRCECGREIRCECANRQAA